MKYTAQTLLTAVIGGMITLGAYKLLEPKRFVSFEEQQHVPVLPASMSESVKSLTASTALSGAKGASVSSSGLPDFVGPAAVSTQAVVHITTTYKARASRGDQMNDMFGDFFGGMPQQRMPSKAFGSGVIISPDGYVVTNNHVIEDANNILVVLENKKSFKAKLIGTDPNTDIALLKVQGENLPILKFGNSDQVKVGEWVLAVGNPFNLTSTVTAGIVSAKGRSIGIIGSGGGHANPYAVQSRQISPVESFIQTDAAVNRGNSGGALVNINAQLIGINSAIASGGGNYEGYSFAVPVNLVKKVVDDLKNFGTVQRGFLGVRPKEVDAQLVQEKHLNDKDLRGVYIDGVESTSAAKSAGIVAGDIVTSIQGVAINSYAELQEQVSRYRPGDAVNVAVLRDGSEKVYKVVLRNRAGDTKLYKKEPTTASISLVTADLTKDDKIRFDIPFGVRVTKVEAGSIRDAGLKPGFIILRINEQEIRSSEEASEILTSANNDLQIEYIDPREPRLIRSFHIKP